MSQFWIGNLYLMLSMLMGAAGQVALKHVMNRTGPLSLDSRMFFSVVSTGSAPVAGMGIALLIASALFWFACLGRLDLSYAYPVACASAIFVVFFGVIFLGEAATFRSVVATCLIVAGTAMLATTR
jgi:multidrug transporter EmrE-like cation transporter